MYLSSIKGESFKIRKEDLLKVNGDIEKILPKNFNPNRLITIEDNNDGMINRRDFTLDGLKNGLPDDGTTNVKIEKMEQTIIALEKKVNDLLNVIENDKTVIEELNDVVSTLTINVLNLERLALIKGILNG